MITLFTTNSCSSCKKAKKWFDAYQIPYVEKNIFIESITKNEILEILHHTENGFDDIISTRSKVATASSLNIDKMRMSQLIDFIIENPSILRRPIIIEGSRMQIGYNEEEIRCFIPRHLRNSMYARTETSKNCIISADSFNAIDDKEI